MSTERMLPQNIEAEEATLGSVLIDSDAWEEINFLAPEDFYRDAHTIIYRAMQSLAARGVGIDSVTVDAELEQAGQLEEAGGSAYVSSLVNVVPTAAYAHYYADIVAATALRRAIILEAGKMAALPYNEADTLSALHAQIERLSRLANRHTREARFCFIPASEVEDLPPMEWLIGGMIPLEATSAVWGIEGCGKSFVLLDMACCIATGQYWRSHAVKRIGVIAYIAGEGMKGMSLRIRAWREARGLAKGAVDNLFMIGKAPQLLQPEDLQALLSALRALPQKPDLVIIDTLARSTAGADENGQKEMGMMVLAMDTIKQEFGAQVLTAHHANASGERMRGSTVLPGAFETIIKISQEVEGIVKITCQKQKDGAAKFAPIHLRLQQVRFQETPDLTTCILVETTPEEALSATDTAYKQLLELLQCQGATASSKKWEQDAKTLLGWRHERYDEIRRALLAAGYVSKGPRKMDPYQLTPKGLAVLEQSKQFKNSPDGLDGSREGRENSPDSPVSKRLDYPDYSTPARCPRCNAPEAHASEADCLAWYERQD